MLKFVYDMGYRGIQISIVLAIADVCFVININ